jgi:hypothetical protein
MAVLLPVPVGFAFADDGAFVGLGAPADGEVRAGLLGLGELDLVGGVQAWDLVDGFEGCMEVEVGGGDAVDVRLGHDGSSFPASRTPSRHELDRCGCSRGSLQGVPLAGAAHQGFAVDPVSSSLSWAVNQDSETKAAVA